MTPNKDRSPYALYLQAVLRLPYRLIIKSILFGILYGWLISIISESKKYASLVLTSDFLIRTTNKPNSLWYITIYILVIVMPISVAYIVFKKKILAENKIKDDDDIQHLQHTNRILALQRMTRRIEHVNIIFPIVSFFNCFSVVPELQLLVICSMAIFWSLLLAIWFLVGLRYLRIVWREQRRT